MNIWTACLIGLMATGFMDLSAWLRLRLWGVRGLDYRLVGRWLLSPRSAAHPPPPITQRPAQAGERAVGWAVHGASGLAFALLSWQAHTLAPAVPRLVLCLGTGLITMALPLLLMQPGMGLGVAASRTPTPWRARRGTLFAHLSYGLGLWLAWWLVDRLAR